MRSLPTVRRLLLHRQQFLVGHSVLASRSFSSSLNGKSSSELEKGFELASGLWHRFRSRLSELEQYQDRGVFIDSLSTFAQCWLFLQLQLPKKTHVDILDFVHGASIASEATLRATNNGAFPEFLAGKEKNSSQVADHLTQYMVPACYNQMALLAKKNYLHRNFYVECEDMKIEKTQLAQVMYHRLTETEYQDWINFKKSQTGAISPEASIEHLRLHVNVATVEDLKVVHLEGETRYEQHQNVYRVVFESRVTDPDEVDWRIDSMYIIKQQVIPRSQDTSINYTETR